MDIRLPQMNGYDAFKIISKQRPALPVIAQTAFALTEDTNRCLDMGFANYISKPINRKNLLNMINTYLSKY
jgi:CheY-like chemotaxis protein